MRQRMPSTYDALYAEHFFTATMVPGRSPSSPAARSLNGPTTSCPYGGTASDTPQHRLRLRSTRPRYTSWVKLAMGWTHAWWQYGAADHVLREVLQANGLQERAIPAPHPHKEAINQDLVTACLARGHREKSGCRGRLPTIRRSRRRRPCSSSTCTSRSTGTARPAHTSATTIRTTSQWVRGGELAR